MFIFKCYYCIIHGSISLFSPHHGIMLRRHEVRDRILLFVESEYKERESVDREKKRTIELGRTHNRWDGE